MTTNTNLADDLMRLAALRTFERPDDVAPLMRREWVTVAACRWVSGAVKVTRTKQGEAMLEATRATRR